MDKVSKYIENLKQVDIKEIEFSLLFDKKYLFDRNPTEVFIYEQWIYVIVLVNIFLSIVAFILLAGLFSEVRPKFRFVRKVSFLWFTNSILLLFYNLMRSESVVLLSMRVFLLIILLFYILIILYAIFFWLFLMPKKIDSFKKAKMRSKYSQSRGK